VSLSQGRDNDLNSQNGNERRNETEEEDGETEAKAESQSTRSCVCDGTFRVRGEGSVQGVFDDVASFGKVLRVSRVSSFDESLVANCTRKVEFESSIGSEEDVEASTKRVGEVLWKVGSGASSERVGVIRVDGFRFGRGRVGEVILVLFLVLVEPKNEVEVLCRVLLEDEVTLTLLNEPGQLCEKK